MDKNEVYVTTNLNDDSLWKPELTMVNAHWIGETPAEGDYTVRVRHRAALVGVHLSFTDSGEVNIVFENPERAVAPGQSIVIYDGSVCVGGGIVA